MLTIAVPITSREPFSELLLQGHFTLLKPGYFSLIVSLELLKRVGSEFLCLVFLYYLVTVQDPCHFFQLSHGFLVFVQVFLLVIRFFAVMDYILQLYCPVK